MPNREWRFDFRVTGQLPPLAWIVSIDGRDARVDCGTSVRVEDGGVFEGTWAGPDELRSVAAATTVFGSGLVIQDGDLVVVAPSHSLEPVYAITLDGALILSNSLVGLLEAAGLELDAKAPYPDIFRTAADLKGFPQDTPDGPLRGCLLTIPTTTQPVTGLFYENALIRDHRLHVVAKRRETTFASYADYRQRLFAATASLFANAAPRDSVVAPGGDQARAPAACRAHRCPTDRATAQARPFRA